MAGTRSPKTLTLLAAALATSTVFAAPPAPVYIYGTGLDTNGDKIYRIQINSDNKSEVFATLSGGDPAATDTTSPNGIAVDKARGLIFYSVDHDAVPTTPDKLYSIPLNTGAVATPTLRGTVIEDANAPAEQEVANGAAMYEGDYYYLKNRTNKWYKAILDDDGNVVENVLACTAGDASGYELGDITGLQGVLYGSVRDLNAAETVLDTEFKFITLKLSTCVLNEYNQSIPRQMQLAWGVDYSLYGYDPADQLLYLIDKDTGARSAGPDYTTGTNSIGLVTMSDIDSLPPEARVTITKKTNGTDNEQDWEAVPEITVGETVTWTYEVANAGQLELTNVTVTDDKLANDSTDIKCDENNDGDFDDANETDNVIPTLAVDAETTCKAEGIAEEDEYENVGTVTADYVSQVLGAGTVDDEDFDRYVGVVDEDAEGAAFIIINHRAIRKDTQVNKDGGSIGPLTGTWTTADVGAKAKGKRSILPYFANNVGRTITILAGHVGFEAWFAPSCVPNKWLSPTTRDQDNTCLAPGSADFTSALNNYFFFGQTPYTGAPASVPASAGSSVDEKKLDYIPYVLPLRARGLKGLEGKKVCAVLYDANVPTVYNPVEPKITGDLKGFTYGIAAFEVLTATPRDKGQSAVTCAREKCLPEMTIKILDPAVTCNKLELSDAPVPNHRVVPSDWYQVNPLYNAVGPNGYRALFYSDLK